MLIRSIENTPENFESLLEASGNLLQALRRLFENPHYQSVFLAAAKNNVYYEGEDIYPYVNALSDIIEIEEQTEDPIVHGDEYTVNLPAHAVLYAGVWPRDMLHKK